MESDMIYNYPSRYPHHPAQWIDIEHFQVLCNILGASTFVECNMVNLWSRKLRHMVQQKEQTM